MHITSEFYDIFVEVHRSVIELRSLIVYDKQ